MKYIVLQTGEPVVFSDRESHKNVAAGRLVLSAGFCRIETYRNNYDDLRAHCSVWGMSDSLDVESEQVDAQLIESLFL